MTDDLETILRRGQDRLRGAPEPTRLERWRDYWRGRGASICFVLAALFLVVAIVAKVFALLAGGG